MILRRITDWDDAYTNGAHIPGGERWPGAWVTPAADYRRAMADAGRARLALDYGVGERNRFDLFLPEGAPQGLVVFVHGGYWMRFDRSFWSHLAAGPAACGFAVAMPSYPLCPDVRLAEIAPQVAQAIEAAAATVGGPMYLTGHSAGGHLVTRMMCMDSPLSAATRARIRHVVSISGVHDLRPLLRTAMNATLQLDAGEAAAQSPALLEPIQGARLTCWVGGSERSEFIRQNALLANIWKGLGAATATVEEPDRHHFNVIDGLTQPDHLLTRTLLEA